MEQYKIDRPATYMTPDEGEFIGSGEKTSSYDDSELRFELNNKSDVGHTHGEICYGIKAYGVDGSIAIGGYTFAYGATSIAHGPHSKALANSSYAGGINTLTTTSAGALIAEPPFVRGSSSAASNGIALGSSVHNFGLLSHSVGSGLQSYFGYETVLGKYNVASDAKDGERKQAYFDYQVICKNGATTVFEVPSAYSVTSISAVGVYSTDGSYRVLDAGEYTKSSNSVTFNKSPGAGAIVQISCNCAKSWTSLSENAIVIGNGNKSTERSNAHTLDWNGNAWYSGDVYVGSTSGINKDSGSKKLATEEYVNSKIAELIAEYFTD